MTHRTQLCKRKSAVEQGIGRMEWRDVCASAGVIFDIYAAQKDEKFKREKSIC